VSAVETTSFATACPQFPKTPSARGCTSAIALFPVAVVAMMPSSRYPAWAMLEYASIRLMSVWAMAIRLPATMVTAAIVHTRGVQSSVSGWNDVSRTRISAANAATFVPAAM